MSPLYFRRAGDPDKVEFLKGLPLFAGLSKNELAVVADQMRLVEYKRGDFVYREGDPADCLYVIVSGRLKVFDIQGGREKVYSHLYEGDYFGELSLLTGEPHSVNVLVLNDALLLRLEKESFSTILTRSPQIAIHISRILGSRLKKKNREGEKIAESTTLAVFSGAERVGKTQFAINLAASLAHETGKRTVLVELSEGALQIPTLMGLKGRAVPLMLHQVATIEEGLLKQSIVTLPPDLTFLGVSLQQVEEADAKKVPSLLSALTFSYDFIIVDLPKSQHSVVLATLYQSDRIYLVTDGDPSRLLQTRQSLRDIEAVEGFQDRLRLVLNQRSGPPDLSHIEAQLGTKIHRLLPNAPSLEEDQQAREIPFVLGNPTSGYSRAVRYLAREIGDVLVGLALGSGAALGFAHIGVLKVLEREKIPIDLVAGSSMGAVVAAAWACGVTPQEMEEVVSTFTNRWKTFALLADFDLLWFQRGFFRGEKVTKLLRKVYGNKTFQDTWLPLKVLAVNFNTREEVILDHGSIYEAVRTSISIPGIVQPRMIRGNLFVDGAVMSPVPVEPLRRVGADKVIAVNVLPSPKAVLEKRKRLEEVDAKRREAIEKKGFFAKIAYRARLTFRRAFSPSIFNIMMQSMQTMEHQISEVACSHADVVIRTTAISASWHEFFEAKKFIRWGEEETEKLLPEIKQLVLEGIRENHEGEK